MRAKPPFNKENPQEVLKERSYGNLFSCHTQGAFHPWTKLSLAQTGPLSPMLQLSVMGSWLCIGLFRWVRSVIYIEAVPVSGLRLCYKASTSRVFQALSGLHCRYSIQHRDQVSDQQMEPRHRKRATAPLVWIIV